MEANAEMGGLCQDRCEDDRRGGRLEEEVRDRGCKILSDEEVTKLRAAPHP